MLYRIQETLIMTSAKPTITIPEIAAPTELVKDDLVVGTGDEATKGKNV